MIKIMFPMIVGTWVEVTGPPETGPPRGSRGVPQAKAWHQM